MLAFINVSIPMLIPTLEKKTLTKRDHQVLINAFSAERIERIISSREID
jgi:hypothetical protein